MFTHFASFADTKTVFNVTAFVWVCFSPLNPKHTRFVKFFEVCTEQTTRYGEKKCVYIYSGKAIGQVIKLEVTSQIKSINRDKYPVHEFPFSAR